jgi:hypothetical protein
LAAAGDDDKTIAIVITVTATPKKVRMLSPSVPEQTPRVGAPGWIIVARSGLAYLAAGSSGPRPQCDCNHGSDNSHGNSFDDGPLTKIGSATTQHAVDEYYAPHRAENETGNRSFVTNCFAARG